MDSSDGRATRYLAELERGDPRAADELFQLLYDDLRNVAGGLLRKQRSGHTLQPTAVVHDCYLRLVQGADAGFSGRAHFLAVAAKAMRHLLLSHERDRCALKRGGAGTRVALVEETPGPEPDVDLIALDEALKELAELDERLARIVELRYFGGLTVKEVAHALGVSERTVAGDWSLAKSWLFRRLLPGSDA